ncbi:hypothetical protein GON03_06045 [Nocardioides sp. MAH-18]|uniref:DUF541 domain-containing protein n=1 Tax=Nocardioides agri TaxID=2682843 RepID=A0A6L6XQ87_9ACTN|nr:MULTISPECIES: hypothetical protein [unclassified Nocardioides]MBA2953874.1 hypothetical protein [Nocardioides sp. CGMCC 1.13656]MVQ48736.1 hypothetical protein [Nocardioides sp. MAH-18]
MSLRLLTRVAAGTAALAVLSGCGTTSIAEAEARVENEPGVVTVRASQMESPDTLPFLIQVPIDVRVVMESDSTEAEILDVLEAYSEDVDDEVVSTVEVVLRGLHGLSVLATRQGVRVEEVEEQAVDDLVEAQEDAALAVYRRELTKYRFGDEDRLVESVEVRLAAPSGYDEVFAAADRYREAEGPVTVRSGSFELGVDEYGEVTEAKTRLIRDAGERFRLRSVWIADIYGMTLRVDASDVPAATRYVESHVSRETGRVDVAAAT